MHIQMITKYIITKYPITLGLIVLSFCFTACSGSPKHDDHTDETKEEAHTETEEAEVTEHQMRTVGITVGRLEQRNLSGVLRVNGVLAVNPQDMATVSTLQDGLVKRILVTEGQHVSAGQVVAYVESTNIVQLQQNFLAAKKEMEAARTELERQQTLAARDAGVKKNLQQARTTLALARVQADGLSRQLSQLGISPARVTMGHITTLMPVKTIIGGVVSRVTVATGGYANMGQPLMTIVDNSAVFADLKVFQKDLSRVRIGQKVDAVLTNNPQVTLHGVISKVNPTLDEQTKAVSVHVRFESSTATLIPGMYVTASICTGSNITTAIPSAGIVSMEGLDYIYVLTGQSKSHGEAVSKFRKVQVKTGITDMGYTEVQPIENIVPQTPVVTAGAFYLSSMMADHGEHTH